jgi:hypothetical protein
MATPANCCFAVATIVLKKRKSKRSLKKGRYETYWPLRMRNATMSAAETEFSCAFSKTDLLHPCRIVRADFSS